MSSSNYYKEQDPEYERLIRAAETHLAQGSYDNAEKFYEKIRYEYPYEYEGWLGMIAVETKNYSITFPLDDDRIKHMNKMKERAVILAPERVRPEIEKQWRDYLEKRRIDKEKIEKEKEEKENEKRRAEHDYWETKERLRLDAIEIFRKSRNTWGIILAGTIVLSLILALIIELNPENRPLFLEVLSVAVLVVGVPICLIVFIVKIIRYHRATHRNTDYR